MIDRSSIQLTGELAVRKKLVKHGHIILGYNVRRAPYEFDIVSQYQTKLFVHEVRSTMLVDTSITSHFPVKKLLTIHRGIELYFPSAILYCYLVRIDKNNQIIISMYSGSELL